MAADALEALKAWFKEMDSENKGVITKHELGQYLLGQGVPQNEIDADVQAVRNCISKFLRSVSKLTQACAQIDDELGATDGNITFEELVAWYQKSIS